MSIVSNRSGARRSRDTGPAARPQRRIAARLSAIMSTVAAAIIAANKTRVPF